MLKKAVLALLVVALMLVAAGCGTEPEATSEPEPAQGETTEFDGEALLNAKCGSCHSVDTVLAAEYDTVGWAAVIDEMIARGATLTDDEAADLAEYLSLR